MFLVFWSQSMGSELPDQGLNLCRLLGRLITTGPPGDPSFLYTLGPII